MKARFIDKFSVILLDMGNTFMFANDRFGPEVDYYSTYRDVGGSKLGSETISQLINTLFNHLLVIGGIPAYYDNFGTVRSYLEELSKSAELPDSELDILENVFAQHEVGLIPDSHVEIMLLELNDGLDGNDHSGFQRKRGISHIVDRHPHEMAGTGS